MTNNIKWGSHMLSVLFVILMLLCMIGFIVALIRFFLKKGKVRWSVCTGTFMAIFFILLCAVNMRDYAIDRWFYDLRTDIMNIHSEVADIDYSFGRADMSLFVYLDDSDTPDSLYDTAVSVFNSMTDYFLHDNGIQESKSSWLKRNQAGYTGIQISFYQKGNETPIVHFESDYDTDGNQEGINNYQVWRKEYKGEIDNIVPPIEMK